MRTRGGVARGTTVSPALVQGRMLLWWLPVADSYVWRCSCLTAISGTEWWRLGFQRQGFRRGSLSRGTRLPVAFPSVLNMMGPLSPPAQLPVCESQPRRGNERGCTGGSMARGVSAPASFPPSRWLWLLLNHRTPGFWDSAHQFPQESAGCRPRRR